ncbi:MAG: hypothetical protein GXY82_08520 [Methanospirillum sp.]|nr:hypothetical protein [Methanospirillum sp.]
MRGGRVILYFNQVTWIAGNEPVSAFDYNANGRIDYNDAVWLFNQLSVFTGTKRPVPPGSACSGSRSAILS